jgi:hypothetical protein
LVDCCFSSCVDLFVTNVRCPRSCLNARPRNPLLLICFTFYFGRTPILSLFDLFCLGFHERLRSTTDATAGATDSADDEELQDALGVRASVCVCVCCVFICVCVYMCVFMCACACVSAFVCMRLRVNTKVRCCGVLVSVCIQRISSLCDHFSRDTSPNLKHKPNATKQTTGHENAAIAVAGAALLGAGLGAEAEQPRLSELARHAL